MSQLRVVVDDGLLLAGALLAAGAWPELEQAARPYKPHRAAEAVAGRPGEWGGGELLGAAFAGAWPEGVAAHLDNFAAQAQIDHLRAAALGDWETAQADLSAVLGRAQLGGFLARLLGPELLPITVFPNLLYPGSESVTALTTRGWLLCLPPPLAWGTSPPWRYGERPDEVLARAAEHLARVIILGALPEAQAGVFGLAAAVLLLREAEGAEAAEQFMLMERRTRKLPGLPGVVATLAGKEGMAACAAALADVCA